MKSKLMKVPRNFIKKFYQHPEPYGDGYYVVTLINDMYTDIFYHEDGYFLTRTNNTELIRYLKHNTSAPRIYFYKKDKFSLRHVEVFDNATLIDWNSRKPIIKKIKLSKTHNLPEKFMVCFCWVEVGFATIKDELMMLSIYENKLISKNRIKDAVYIFNNNQ